MNNKKVKDFKKCWCEATRENYKALIEIRFVDVYNDFNKNSQEIKAFELGESNEILFHIFNSFDDFLQEEIIPNKLKQIHLVNGEWEYVEEKCKICGEPKNICRSEDTCSYKIKQVCDNPDVNSSKIINKDLEKDYIEIDGYKFEKPKFECKLLKIVKDKKDKPYIIGYKIDDRKNLAYPYPRTWTIDGLCWDNSDNNIEEDNLTPLKPKWYEDENNFPCLVKNIHTNMFMIAKKATKNSNNIQCVNTFQTFNHELFIPATKEEVLQLLVKE